MRVLLQSLLGLVFLLSALSGQSRILPNQLAPFVPSPQPVVEKMLELASVKTDEKLYDLGCGDGRVPITAAKKFRAKSFCVELSPRLVRISRNNVREEGLEDRVEVVPGDMMEVDLRQADVVTLYLLTDANEALKPKLENELKKGARVVSHDFEFMHWVPVKIEKMEIGHRTHTLYLYIMPPKKLDQ